MTNDSTASNELSKGESLWADERAVMQVLASNSSAQTIMALKPSKALARMSELLARNKEGSFCREEEIEMERYLTLEHLVRLAKANAGKQLAQVG